MINKNQKLLKEFTSYCKIHPSERFWQALRNWAEVGFVSVSNGVDDMKDTFYWKGRNR
jgi:hypothetical protein